MELNSETVKKALECCGDNNLNTCEKCPMDEKKKDNCECGMFLVQNALALITSQEQRIEAYRQELAEVRVALAEANKERQEFTEDVAEKVVALIEFDKQITRLTEENERLNASCTELTQECKKWQGRLKIECEYTRADTVRKIHSEIKDRCIKGGIYPAFVARTIDQIAKEMEEGKNEA